MANDSFTTHLDITSEITLLASAAETGDHLNCNDEHVLNVSYWLEPYFKYLIYLRWS